MEDLQTGYINDFSTEVAPNPSALVLSMRAIGYIDYKKNIWIIYLKNYRHALI